MKNRDIETGAKTIASDFHLPGGRRKKLARLVAEHLAWFDLAEARGLTWDDMIAVLAAAGIRRDDGRPLSRGALSSAVWRKRQDGRVASGAKAELSHEKGGDVPARRPPSRKEQGAPEPQNVGRRAGGRPAAKVAVRKKAAAAGRSVPAGTPTRQHDASDTVLAYMQRAARIRRNTDEAD